MPDHPTDPVFRPGLFAGTVALVTGGGSGIGATTARQLAGLGAHVVLAGRTQSRLDDTADLIRSEGGQVSTQAGDIRDDDDVAAIVAAATAPTGRIDVLVNNAGGQFFSPVDGISRNGFEAVVATNLTGTFLMCKAVHAASMRDHGGAIVNMGMLNQRGFPGMAHSGAARAGVDNLTQTLALEWAPSGIRVNGVAPGWIDSSGVQTYPEHVRALLAGVVDQTPARRAGTELEVANAITFLASPGATFITGVTLRIDGGAELARPNWFVAEHDNWPAAPSLD